MTRQQNKLISFSGMNRITRRFLVPLCTLAVVVSFAVTASAQTNVALVDVGLVFKNHPSFKPNLDALKKEAEEFQINAQKLQQQLMQKAEVLKQWTPGSPEFKAKESELAQESARLEVEQKDIMRKLMVREAELHFDTYVEVTNFIADYCKQHGIQLVLRYNSAPMEATDANSIMQRVNGSVVYHRNQKDITNVIIQQLIQVKGTARGGGNLNR